MFSYFTKTALHRISADILREKLASNSLSLFELEHVYFLNIFSKNDQRCRVTLHAPDLHKVARIQCSANEAHLWKHKAQITLDYTQHLSCEPTVCVGMAD